MKIFLQRELREALAYSAAGGVALHLCDGAIADAIAAVRHVPGCFRGRKEFAHMFGPDAELLKRIAKRCGVRVLFVDRAGTPAQHVDLVGGPLERAKELFGHAVAFPESGPAALTHRMVEAFVDRRGAPTEFRQEYVGEFFPRDEHGRPAR